MCAGWVGATRSGSRATLVVPRRWVHAKLANRDALLCAVSGAGYSRAVDAELVTLDLGLVTCPDCCRILRKRARP